MSTKKSYAIEQKRSDPLSSNENLLSTGDEAQIREPYGKPSPNFPLRAVNPVKPRILIVHEDDSISKEMELVLFHEGLELERVKTMTGGCEAARSGRFQVVVSAPVLRDGTWKRLADIDSHYRPGFVIILVATNFDLHEWGEALEDGAFDVLDALHELPKVGEIARRALWAAYLKGAGPRPEALVHMGVA
jgi:DNA-binding NtrC family response regulator